MIELYETGTQAPGITRPRQAATSTHAIFGNHAAKVASLFKNLNNEIFTNTSITTCKRYRGQATWRITKIRRCITMFFMISMYACVVSRSLKVCTIHYWIVRIARAISALRWLLTTIDASQYCHFQQTNYPTMPTNQMPMNPNCLVEKAFAASCLNCLPMCDGKSFHQLESCWT